MKTAFWARRCRWSIHRKPTSKAVQGMDPELGHDLALSDLVGAAVLVFAVRDCRSRALVRDEEHTHGAGARAASAMRAA